MEKLESAQVARTAYADCAYPKILSRSLGYDFYTGSRAYPRGFLWYAWLVLKRCRTSFTLKTLS